MTTNTTIAMKIIITTIIVTTNSIIKSVIDFAAVAAVVMVAVAVAVVVVVVVVVVVAAAAAAAAGVVVVVVAVVVLPRFDSWGCRVTGFREVLQLHPRRHAGAHVMSHVLFALKVASPSDHSCNLLQYQCQSPAPQPARPGGRMPWGRSEPGHKSSCNTTLAYRRVCFLSII